MSRYSLILALLLMAWQKKAPSTNYLQLTQSLWLDPCGERFEGFSFLFINFAETVTQNLPQNVVDDEVCVRRNRGHAGGRRQR
jgi:hypothetical protein